MPGTDRRHEQQNNGAEKIRKDAEGQFAPKKHGGQNDGLDSAAPVATTGDGDATLDNDPGGEGDER